MDQSRLARGWRVGRSRRARCTSAISSGKELNLTAEALFALGGPGGSGPRRDSKSLNFLARRLVHVGPFIGEEARPGLETARGGQVVARLVLGGIELSIDLEAVAEAAAERACEQGQRQ